MDKSKELKIAIKAAKKAGIKLLEQINKRHSYKIGEEYIADGVRSLKADADFLADEIIKTTLRREFPQYNLLTEESGSIKKEGSRFTWVIDPLCGTLAYLRGLKSDFAVSIALLKRQEFFLGVVFVPGTGELFWAQKGQGAYLNNQKIKVSKRRGLDKAAVSIEHNVSTSL